MSAAHQQAARRLAALSRTERDWVLARLAAEDALRIRDLMEPRTPAPAEPEPPVEAAPAEIPSTPQAIVGQASAAEVAELLREEPDWFIALVLAKQRWPWDREVLAGFEPARLEELAALAWRARESARPRACEAAIEVLAAKLRELAPPPAAAANAFDEVLGGMLA